MVAKSDEELLDEASANADDDESDAPEDALKDASDRLRPQTKKGRPGRKRRPRPTGVTHEAKSEGLAEGDDSKARAFASKDAAVVWDYVLEQARLANRPPELIGISVQKLGIGAYPSDAQNMNMINGDLVCGDEHTSPGDALVRYITEVYHIPTSNTPKLYKLGFFYRTGLRNQIQAPIAELRLGAPQEIQAQRAAEERFRQQKAINDAVKGARAPYQQAQGLSGPPATYGGQPYPQAPPMNYPGPLNSYPGFYPPPPIPGSSPELEAMRREMATMMGAITERARLEGLAPPPAPVAPVVQAPSAEETAARTAQVVAQVLTGMGFTPQLAQKLNSPQLTAASAQAAVADPMDLMEQMFDRFDKFERIQDRMRNKFTPEEEEEKPPVVVPAMEATKVEVDKTLMKPIPIPAGFTGGKQIFYGERGVDESALDYGIRLFMHNPETGANVLSLALKGMSNSAVGQAIAGLISKGMPGVASMVQAQHAAQLQNGAGANGAVSTPGPQQAPAATWGAPKGI